MSVTYALLADSRLSLAQCRMGIPIEKHIDKQCIDVYNLLLMKSSLENHRNEAILSSIYASAVLYSIIFHFF